jgi:hypothetical protein
MIGIVWQRMRAPLRAPSARTRPLCGHGAKAAARHPRASTMNEVLRRSSSSFLNKPFRPLELARTVRRALERVRARC